MVSLLIKQLNILYFVNCFHNPSFFLFIEEIEDKLVIDLLLPRRFIPDLSEYPISGVSFALLFGSSNIFLEDSISNKKYINFKQ